MKHENVHKTSGELICGIDPGKSGGLVLMRNREKTQNSAREKQSFLIGAGKNFKSAGEEKQALLSGAGKEKQALLSEKQSHLPEKQALFSSAGKENCSPIAGVGEESQLILAEKQSLLAEKYEVLEGWPMPEDDDCAIVELLRGICDRVSAVYIEQIPKFAGENRSAAFMAVLFGNYRLMAGAVLMHGKPRLIEMPLLLWMNQIIPTKQRSRDRAMRKKQLKEASMRLWPEWKWTNATCDAPLIAMAGHSLGR